jgi:hypothetical protein
VRVDVLSLLEGDGDPGLVRGELLEGTNPDAGEAFDAWLLVERRRLAGVCEGVLRDAALSSLAAGLPLDGAGLASRALSLSPFDESLHELLVRCLARAGQVGAARHHVSACEVLFRRELGRPPDPRVRRAADEGGPTGRRRAAIGLPRSDSSKRGWRRWPPVRLSPEWPACGWRVLRLALAVIRSCSLVR